MIREQNFDEWLKRKEIEEIQRKKAIQDKEESESSKKQHKELESQARLEMWFKRQAELMDNQRNERLAKEKRKQEDKLQKKREEEERKAQSKEAFRLWLSRKKETVKVNKTEEEVKRGSMKTKSGSIVIGPYSYATGLRNIQKNVTINFKNENTNEVDQSRDKSEIELQKNNIEDSLQELSSIKKDTPIQENEQDYD